MAAFAVHSPARSTAFSREMFGTLLLSYANARLQIFAVVALMGATWMMVGGMELVRSGVR